ncbi:putative glutathione S-transferase-like [Capsicum annuum]|nr:putative glutathione S-transferase-like [Capsicum annuum]
MDRSELFKFSPTTESASYALKKHYFTLLHHFEQVYFFRHNFPGSKYFQVEGTIDSKLDCGYLVSMKMGSEVLSGVRYQPHQQVPSSSSMLAAQNCNTIVAYNPPSHHHSERRYRRRKNGDPNRPKVNRSGYNFFFVEKHVMLKYLYPHKEREFTKMIGESWNNHFLEEKMVVAEKKWREVSSVFKFSPTTTSASYALRKHHFTLLHHFEQVFFFTKDWSIKTIGERQGKEPQGIGV